MTERRIDDVAPRRAAIACPADPTAGSIAGG